MLCAVLIITGTSERTCTSDGAGDAGSTEELSRGQCVSACVCACVWVWWCMHVCVCIYVRLSKSEYTTVNVLGFGGSVYYHEIYQAC